MWKKSTVSIAPVDSKIVTRDFIVAEGFNSGYTFLDKENNPFGRSLWVPVFYTFKVHKNHPMNIFSSGINHTNIYPANELKKKRQRMHAEVFRDKMDYDLTTFMIVPYENPEVSKYWSRFDVKDGFISETDNTMKDISLLYLSHGTSIHGSDNIHRLSEVMPSQLLKHFFYWLIDCKKIISHDKTFDQKLEGKVEVPLERARILTAEVSNILEKRYDTQLAFKDYRELYSGIFNQKD
ncbi:MAG: hypothetical protein Q7S33_06075 [Nanoarchaeota archaeon]|nr:hypothetical protein [Nanoarchaeota archaeon]